MFHTHFNSSNLLWSHKYFVEPQIFCGDNCNSHYDHTCIIPHIYLNSYCGAVYCTHLNSYPDFHILSLLCNFFNWWICFCWMDWAWVSAGQKILFKSLLSSILPHFPLLDAAPPFFEQQSLIIPLPLTLCSTISHQSRPSFSTQLKYNSHLLLKHILDCVYQEIHTLSNTQYSPTTPKIDPFPR